MKLKKGEMGYLWLAGTAVSWAKLLKLGRCLRVNLPIWVSEQDGAVLNGAEKVMGKKT